MKEPRKEDFGWYASEGIENESGWAYPEGEEKYLEALAKWQNHNIGWISVKDRLPDYSNQVIVFKEHHKAIEIANRTHTSSKGDFWSCEYGHYITHWMPLPNPPQEGQQVK